MRPRTALAGVALVALVLLWPLGPDASGGGRWRDVASRGHDYSLSLPIGWRRAEQRLVPKLVMPREVLSVANFEMTVGQGGNCGREPLAAIHLMRPGDALLSVQEYRLTPGLRAHLRRNFQQRPARLDRADLRHSPWGGSGGTSVEAATIPFSDHGRAFDALVYIAGGPTGAARADLDGILRRLRFLRVSDERR
jgi:hypothetical protein